MLLSKLLSGLISEKFPDLEITGITNDSRAVRPGFLFLAYKGEKSDGRDFIPQAIKNGATVILYEEKNANFSLAQSLAHPAAVIPRLDRGIHLNEKMDPADKPRDEGSAERNEKGAKPLDFSMLNTSWFNTIST